MKKNNARSKSLETTIVALKVLELLVKTPSIELPPGQVKDWVEKMRENQDQEQDIIFQEAYSHQPTVFSDEINPNYRKDMIQGSFMIIMAIMLLLQRYNYGI